MQAAGRHAPERASGSASWPSDPVEILRDLYPLLLRAARSLWPAEQDLQDHVQEALVEVLIRYPNFDGIVHPFGYARTVLSRRAWANRAHPAPTVTLDLVAKLDARRPPFEDQVVDRQALIGALGGLGRKQRVCISLRYLNGLDDREIAAVLGCRRSTVRSQIARGLRAMRDRLGTAGDEEPGRGDEP